MVSIRQSAPPSILARYCAESVCIECFGCPHGAARRYAAAPRIADEAKAIGAD
jgi:hypothetical protein